MYNNGNNSIFRQIKVWITLQVSQQTKSRDLQHHPAMKMEVFLSLKYLPVEIPLQDGQIVPVGQIQLVRNIQTWFCN